MVPKNIIKIYLIFSTFKLAYVLSDNLTRVRLIVNGFPRLVHNAWIKTKETRTLKHEKRENLIKICITFTWENYDEKIKF